MQLTRCLSLLALLGCRARAPDPERAPDPAREAPTVAMVSATPGPTPAPSTAPTPSPTQRADYLDPRAKTVVETQLYRITSTIDYSTSNKRAGTAILVDLAPAIQVWSLLTLAWADGEVERWHLESPLGRAAPLRLDPAVPTGLMISRGGVEEPCELWGGEPSALTLARASGRAYAPLCGGVLSLRNPVVGSRTRMEWTTDLLRDHVWGGEQVTSLVKETFYADAELQTGELGTDLAADPDPAGGPRAALRVESARGRWIDPGNLGLGVDGASDGRLVVGAWYPLHAVPGAWVSVMQPRFVDPAVLGLVPARLDPVESSAMVYTVAFDLSAFDLGYELGTDHPRVGWSEHALPAVRLQGLPGPDGFDTVSPLARTGQLNGAWLPSLVAVFAGGFKRSHGAMSAGPLSRVNGGSHYGFVEYGTELSRLQPGLATLVVWADQRVELRTWTEDDADRLWQVRHARQDGVPLVETDGLGQIRPGALVSNWSQGNWSGSVEGTLRSVRGSISVAEWGGERFLLYSYFSSATPAAMAAVLMSYQCGYGALLDMNALEHTYLAVHVREGGGLSVQQLVRGMEVLDRQKGGGTYPRFVGYADNRDFFYLTRKPNMEPR